MQCRALICPSKPSQWLRCCFLDTVCSIMPVKPLILFGWLRSPPIKTLILSVKTPILRILILRNPHYRRNALHLLPTNPRRCHTRTIKNRFRNIYNGEHRDHDWRGCVECHGFHRWQSSGEGAWRGQQSCTSWEPAFSLWATRPSGFFKLFYTLLIWTPNSRRLTRAPGATGKESP